MDANRILLFTMIESDRKNINNNTGNITTPRLYEQEAINCFTNWREKAGWLKDIDIVCMCPSNNKPSEETINKLEQLKVTYIEHYLKESEVVPYGFFLVPLIGKLLEERYPSSFMIHIDLDMNIIKPIPDKLFDTKIIKIGQYNIESSKTQRSHSNWELPLDTGFTISHNSSKFYKTFWNYLQYYFKDNYYLTDNDYKLQGTELYFLEEFIADKLYNEKILNIEPIEYYQIGEGYASVEELSDNNISNILFWHEHLFIANTSSYFKDRFKQKINFFKRLKKIENDK